MLWSFKLENWIAIGSSIEFHLYKTFYLVSILLNISVVLSLIGVHCWIFCTTCFTKYFLWYFLTYVIIRRENLIISFHCKCYVVKYVTLAKCSKFEIDILTRYNEEESIAFLKSNFLCEICCIKIYKIPCNEILLTLINDLPNYISTLYGRISNFQFLNCYDTM